MTFVVEASNSTLIKLNVPIFNHTPEQYICLSSNVVSVYNRDNVYTNINIHLSACFNI